MSSVNQMSEGQIGELVNQLRSHGDNYKALEAIERFYHANEGERVSFFDYVDIRLAYLGTCLDSFERFIEEYERDNPHPDLWDLVPIIN